MPSFAPGSSAPKTPAVQGETPTKQNLSASPIQLVDNRPEATLQLKLGQIANAATVQRRANKTGLPDGLKAGVENLSGYSMDDVRVHYNSSQPAQLQAYAYAQGTDIHIAPGQEKHLPHEAWHVVQQKQGRVKPTIQRKGKLNVNDSPGLEREADVMGGKAANSGSAIQLMKGEGKIAALSGSMIQLKLSNSVLNVAGETHSDYEGGDLRAKEKAFAEQKAGGPYWTESEFKVTKDSWWNGKNKGESGDPVRLQFLQCVELIDSLGGSFIGVLDHTVNDQAKLLRERVEDTVRIISGGVKDRYNQLIEEHNDGVRTLSESQTDAAKKLWGKCKDMNVKCLAIYKLIQEDGSLNEGSGGLADLKKDATKINDQIKVFAAAVNDGEAVTQENVRVPRSHAMHFSAQASHTTKGIWKIGNNHFNDIEKYLKGTFVSAQKYNLMSKADFIRERDKFTPEEEKG